MGKFGFIFLIIIIALVGVGALFFFTHDRQRNTADSTANKTTGAKTQKSMELVFSHQIFDPAKISHITPLGELNGGYEEAQALGSVTIWIKPEAVANGSMVDVFAPTDMTLESYAYYKTPDGNDWTLILRVTDDVRLKFDHITQAVDKIVAATTSTPKDNSAEESPKQKVSFTAGEKIAQTRGTNLAKNWNIYMYEGAHKNQFVNQKRYEQGGERSVQKKLLNGVCPFNYYGQEVRAAYIALMGATIAGQANECGNVSKDVAGTLSGMWHFNKEAGEIREERDGQYANPLSVYKNSAGQVIIDQLADVRFDLQGAPDPATVKESQCYVLVNSENRPAGYAFFKINSNMEMMLAYAPNGACPATFPTTDAKTYYR